MIKRKEQRKPEQKCFKDKDGVLKTAAVKKQTAGSGVKIGDSSAVTVKGR